MPRAADPVGAGPGLEPPCRLTAAALRGPESTSQLPTLHAMPLRAQPMFSMRLSVERQPRPHFPLLHRCPAAYLQAACSTVERRSLDPLAFPTRLGPPNASSVGRPVHPRAICLRSHTPQLIHVNCAPLIAPYYLLEVNWQICSSSLRFKICRKPASSRSQPRARKVAIVRLTWTAVSPTVSAICCCRNGNE